MAAGDPGTALQSTATAGAAAAVGGYLIQWWNWLFIAVGFYVHRGIDVIPSNAFLLSDESKVALAGAIGGYVLHRLAKRASPLTLVENNQVREILAQPSVAAVVAGVTGATGAAG